MNGGRLDELIAGYFDRDFPAAEKREMEDMLRASPEARERFWEAAQWQALFQHWGEEETGRQAAVNFPKVIPLATPARRPIAVAPPRGKIIAFPWWKRSIRMTAAAAVVALAFIFARRLFPPTVAELAQLSEAVWSDSSSENAVGAKLKPGTLRLEKGAAVIAFSSGARVVLEGPAELALLDGNEAVLRSGKLRARVPESAHGFKITTPGFTVVDLGTEFGCAIAADGAGEVHVIEGAVELRTAETPAVARPLHVDEAVRVTHGITAAIPAHPGAFLDEEKIKRRELRRHNDPLGSWRSASRELSAHRSALMHFDFEGGDFRMLPNLARSASAPAIIMGGQRTVGRWPGKGALEFRNPGDRLRLVVVGEFEALTLLAWVRAGDVQTRQHLLAPLGEFRDGELDWYFNPDGSLSVGVHLTLESDPARGWSIVKSTPALKAGEWTMVAVVLDRRARSATHFVNGQPVGGGMLESRVPFRPGEIEIGDSERHPDARRNFRGQMDEFAIFSTAFSAEEIRSIYEDCRP